MTKFYSASKNAFFTSEIHSKDQMPTDAVAITDKEYADVFAGQAAGKVIAPGHNGMPVLVPRVVTPAQQAAAVKQAALTALTASDTTVLRCLERGAALPKEWAAYRSALRLAAAGKQTTVPTAPNYPAGS